jgi:membrane protein
MGFLLAIPGRAGGRCPRVRLTRSACQPSRSTPSPALLLAAILVAGTAYGEDVARGRLVEQVARHLGEGLAATVDSVIAGAVSSGATQPVPRVLAVGALFFGASLTFVELQHALNVIWGTGSTRRWYLALAVKRLVSFAMVIVTGALLMAAMAASVGIARFGDWLTDHLPPALAGGLLPWLEPTATLATLTVLFALVFKVLPDGRVPWRRALVGAAVTSSLLLVARTVVVRYLGVVNVASVYGAAAPRGAARLGTRRASSSSSAPLRLRVGGSPPPDAPRPPCRPPTPPCPTAAVPHRRRPRRPADAPAAVATTGPGAWRRPLPVPADPGSANARPARRSNAHPARRAGTIAASELAMLNRSAVVVRPAQPFVEWFAGLGLEGAPPRLDDEPTVYLVPPFDDERRASRC